MAYARFNGVVQDQEGNVQPGATIEVRYDNSQGTLASVYSDRDGNVPLGNPFTADSRGTFGFHAPGGAYRIRATVGEELISEWRYVPVGTAQEYDVDGLAEVIINLVVTPYNAKYMEELKDLAVNDTLLSGGFPGVRTPEEELIRNFGIHTNEMPLAAMDRATCLLIPPTEESTSFVAPDVPYLADYRGETDIRAVPLDIRTSIPGQAVGIPIFEPVKTNAWGWLVWRCISPTPVHGILHGSMNFLIRQSGVIEDPYVRYIMSLRSWDYPQLEAGQNNGRRHLAPANSYLAEPRKLRSYRVPRDLTAPLTPDFRANAMLHENKFQESVEGYFLDGDTSENLRNDVPGRYTTNWVSVEGTPGDEYVYALFPTLSTHPPYTFSVCRVQVKRADGSIYVPDGQATERGAPCIVRIPADASEFRVYFYNPGDPTRNIHIRNLDREASAEADPLKGHWVEAQFNVHREVVFWPGASYALDIYTQVLGEGNAREWGFRPQGGGLSFDFAAGWMRRRLANNLFDR